MTDDTIVIRAPAGTKARYLARFAPREPGSVVVLTEPELRDVMRKAYFAGAYRA